MTTNIKRRLPARSSDQGTDRRTAMVSSLKLKLVGLAAAVAVMAATSAPAQAFSTLWRVSPAKFIASGQVNAEKEECPAGTLVTGGGYWNYRGGQIAKGSFPTSGSGAGAWFVEEYNPTPYLGYYTVVVVCLHS